MIFEKFINFIDKNYHHKRLIKFLKNYKIDLIIDIGSHKGEFIKNIIKYINFQKAYTFEPQKEVFDILKKNLINDNRILHNNLGISDKVGKKKIIINKLTSTSTMSKLDESSYFLKLKNFLIKQKKIKEIYDVETTTVDDYFKGLNLQNTLLKIDVEGHEFNVLEGSKNTIKKIDFVLIENQYFDIYKDNNINECHSFLKNNQFDLIKKFRFPTLHFEDRLYKKN
tara:strand:+ start:479 stop:1153 length:675 start_codon:yes stop_codon:yes gene_type:complete